MTIEGATQAMSFYQRYELLDVLNDGAVKTFRARQVQSGQIVAVHVLIGPQQSLLNKVKNLAGPAREELLEIGENEGTAFVVTPAWNRMVTFEEWVSATAPAGDRFTKAGNWRIPVTEFGRKSEPAAGSPAPPEPNVPPQPAEPHPPSPEPPAPIAPGEFTRMFQAPKATEDSPTVEMPALHPPAKLPNEPGEFTRMFQTPPAAAPPPPRKLQNEPGEFTRMFQTPSVPPHPPPTAKPADPGEFTRFFDTPAPAAATPNAHPAYPDPFARASEPASPSGGPGEFTRMFGVPQAPSPLTPGPVATSPPAAGPGEFTKIFAAPAPPPPKSSPSPPVPPAALPATKKKQKKQSYLPLFIGLGVLLVLFIALILIFALRK